MTSFIKLTALVLAVGIFSVGVFFATLSGSAPQPSSSLPPPEPTPTAPPEPQTQRLRMVAVGDNLIHDNIYKQAEARTGVANSFDFEPVYAALRPLVSGADIAFVNQETPLAQSVAPLAGYPMFNSPDAVGEKLVDLGFNAVCNANNHMLDKGERGLLATLDFWERYPEVTHFGAWRSESDLQTPIVMEKNGIKVGFVPILEHTNGLALPPESSVKLLKSTDYEGIKKQVALTRAASDFLVVSVHWGNENLHKTTEHQRYLTELLSAEGVELILGHHSHTIQPVMWHTAQNGNKTLVAYSMGNLVSSMLDPQNMLGLLMDFEIEKKPENERAQIVSAKAVPLVTQYDGTGRSNVRIYPFSQYSDALAAQHGVRVKHPYFGIDYMTKIIKENIPEEFWGDLT